MKFIVKVSGWVCADEPQADTLHDGCVNKERIKRQLGGAFLSCRQNAVSLSTKHKPVKRQITVAVEIVDVPPRKRRRK